MKIYDTQRLKSQSLFYDCPLSTFQSTVSTKVFCVLGKSALEFIAGLSGLCSKPERQISGQKTRPWIGN